MTPFGKINPVNNNLRYTLIKFKIKPCLQKEKIFSSFTLRFLREINSYDFQNSFHAEEKKGIAKDTQRFFLLLLCASTLRFLREINTDGLKPY